MSVGFINPNDLPALGQIAKALRAVPMDIQADDGPAVYLSTASVDVHSADGYQIGTFYIEDDFWMFRVGEGDE